MRVVAINGSPKPNGNTFLALSKMKEQMEAAGIVFDIIHVGNAPLQGCVGCGTCARLKNEKCRYDQDLVNDAIQKLKEADGIVLASPVYFANIPGTMKSFLDRVFYVMSMNGGMLQHKVGASLCVLRRSGGVETFAALNHYLTYSQMLIPTSNYWNVIHGARPDEIMSDAEGMQIIEVLTNNMIYLMKLVAESTLTPPPTPKKIATNFIR